MQPQTFIFGAKAAPGYQMAKQIIRLLCYISRDIDQNPRIREKLQVVFLEDYNVSLAEALIPAAEISEQISLAGKEASGTGCMKLMMNGALTIGTLDGANVEMLAAVGEDNMFIFGLNSREVDELWTRGYHAASYYGNNERLKRIVNHLHVGFAGESFSDIAMYLLSGYGIADPYMCLADFESYRQTHEEMIAAYADKHRWNRMSLLNIASSGHFAADRSVEEYASRFWNLKKVILDKS
jgi:starch phosphorylase